MPSSEFQCEKAKESKKCLRVFSSSGDVAAAAVVLVPLGQEGDGARGVADHPLAHFLNRRRQFINAD